MTGQDDLQDESLTSQAHDQAAHCLLTSRYFEPYKNKMFSCLPKVDHVIN